jgi:hypothetical protein
VCFFETGTVVEVINLWQNVWCVETGTVGYMIILGQNVLCVETETDSDVIRLVREFVF